MQVAILVDGGFFLKRARHVYPNLDTKDPEAVTTTIYGMATRHLYRRVKNGEVWHNEREGDLHRIFFYDCPPLEKRLQQPVSKNAINLARTDAAIFRKALHQKLRSRRKVALRLGRLDQENAAWQLKPGVLKGLLNEKRKFENLTDDDFVYYARQKVVDIKIGLDIALLAEKRLVEKIVLIAGDSDFVPAAKHARRQGIDFVLDPMWHHIAPDLHEHIDGLRSTCPNPARRREGEKAAFVDELDQGL